jgi:hypothetical protein
MIAVTAALDPKILAHFQLDTYTGLISAEVNLKFLLFLHWYNLQNMGGVFIFIASQCG